MACLIPDATHACRRRATTWSAITCSPLRCRRLSATRPSVPCTSGSEPEARRARPQWGTHAEALAPGVCCVEIRQALRPSTLPLGPDAGKQGSRGPQTGNKSCSASGHRDSNQNAKSANQRCQHKQSLYEAANDLCEKLQIELPRVPFIQHGPPTREEEPVIPARNSNKKNGGITADAS